MHSSTGDSRFFLLYGRDARIPTETVLLQPKTAYQVDMDDYKSELIANMSDAWELAYKNIESAQSKQKVKYDKHSRTCPLKIGDRVMVHMPGEVKGSHGSLHVPFTAHIVFYR